MVHAGLAAHRGIHLRQQRGGQLHEGNAPLIARCGKAGEVTHNTAAQASTTQSRPKALAISTSSTPATCCRFLCCSPSGSVTSTTAPIRQRGANPVGVQRCNGGVAHQQQIARLDVTGQQRAVGQQSVSDQDRIGAIGKGNFEGEHGPAV